MNLPNKISITRMAMAPVFFAISKIPEFLGSGHLVVCIILFVLFLIAEITDILDGHIARKLGLVSSIGKILDPFSDVVTHMTIFFMLVTQGILWDWLFILFIFRELGIILIRMILLSEGTALAASTGGKLKSVLYAIGSGAGIVTMGIVWLQVLTPQQNWFLLGVNAMVGVGIIMSLVSFASYLHGFLARTRT